MPYGLLTPGQVFAMFAQRHMIEFGTKPEQLGQIPITCRKRANANPRAQMHDRPMTIDDYLAARMISDAAATVRLLPGDRWRVRSRRHDRRAGRGPRPAAGADPRRRPVHTARPATWHACTRRCARPTITSLPATAVADVLYRRAGLGPADIDVAQFYDCFSITVLLQIEDWGFCERAKAGLRGRAGRSTSVERSRSTPAAVTSRRATSTV